VYDLTLLSLLSLHYNILTYRQQLTELALRKHNLSEPDDIASHGDDTQLHTQRNMLAAISNLSQVNSLRLVHSCMMAYNAHLCHVQPVSVQQMCIIVSKLCSIGDRSLDGHLKQVMDLLPWTMHWGDSKLRMRRFQLSIPVMSDFVNTITFGLSIAEFSDIAQVALERIHARATHDLSPEILLATTCLVEHLDEFYHGS
jgi:Hyccin